MSAISPSASNSHPGDILPRRIALICETMCLLSVLLLLWPVQVVGTLTGLYLGVLLLAWFPTLLLNTITREFSEDIYRGTNIMFMVLLIFGSGVLLLSRFIG